MTDVIAESNTIVDGADTSLISKLKSHSQPDLNISVAHFERAFPTSQEKKKLDLDGEFEEKEDEEKRLSKSCYTLCDNLIINPSTNIVVNEKDKENDSTESLKDESNTVSFGNKKNHRRSKSFTGEKAQGTNSLSIETIAEIKEQKEKDKRPDSFLASFRNSILRKSVKTKPEDMLNPGKKTKNVILRSKFDYWAPDSDCRLYDYQFDAVFNFRELGGIKSAVENKHIKLHTIFRSATLDYASEEDLHKLCKEVNIRTIIDLRREPDIKASKGNQRVFQIFPEMPVGSSTTGRKRHFVNIIGANYQYQIVRGIPKKTQFIKSIFGSEEAMEASAKKYVADNVLNAAGIVDLYKNILDNCHKQLGTVLKIIANKKNHPVIFHCAHGKDRTGLIAALLLSFAGVTDADIAKDYALTMHGLHKWTDLVHKEICQDSYLSPEFTTANYETMISTLAHIRDSYGSIGNFFSACEVGTEYQVMLRKTLMTDNIDPFEESESMNDLSVYEDLLDDTPIASPKNPSSPLNPTANKQPIQKKVSIQTLTTAATETTTTTTTTTATKTTKAIRSESTPN